MGRLITMLLYQHGFEACISRILTSVAGSRERDRASLAISSKRDPVVSAGTAVASIVVSSGDVVGVDFLLIHCGRILVKLDALALALLYILDILSDWDNLDRSRDIRWSERRGAGGALCHYGLAFTKHVDARLTSNG